MNIAKGRAEKVLGGFCGSHGNCGAGVGTGIFVSVITNATPLSKEAWRLSNLMTAKSLFSIANRGGPRCCKRDSFLAILEAAKFVKEHFGISLPIKEKIVCSFSHAEYGMLKRELQVLSTLIINRMADEPIVSSKKTDENKTLTSKKSYST